MTTSSTASTSVQDDPDGILQLVLDNRQAILLLEAVALIHDLVKFSDEFLKNKANKTDYPAPANPVVTDEQAAQLRKPLITIPNNKFTAKNLKPLDFMQELNLLGFQDPSSSNELAILVRNHLHYSAHYEKEETDVQLPFFKSSVFGIEEPPALLDLSYIAASSWKGNLRWTTMFTRLALKKDELTDTFFAEERFWQTLLFGTEQGFDETRTAGFAAYLEKLKPQAVASYKENLKSHFDTKEIPHLGGHLHFFPTYLDKIAMTVINPHSRTTRAGNNPVYYEVAPEGAKGTFHLLYVPHLPQSGNSSLKESLETLEKLVLCIKAMFLTYGFSAKKTSGMGMAKEANISGSLEVAGLTLLKNPKPSVIKNQSVQEKKKRVTGFENLHRLDLSEVLPDSEPISKALLDKDFERFGSESDSSEGDTLFALLKRMKTFLQSQE